jgi:hypothetical protein
LTSQTQLKLLYLTLVNIRLLLPMLDIVAKLYLSGADEPELRAAFGIVVLNERA